MDKPQKPSYNLFKSLTKTISRFFNRESEPQSMPESQPETKSEPVATDVEHDVASSAAEPKASAAKSNVSGTRSGASSADPNVDSYVAEKSSNTQDKSFKRSTPLVVEPIKIKPLYELSKDEIAPTIEAVVIQHLSDENLSVITLAEQLKTSRTALYQLVHQEFGVTPANYIMRKRLDCAELWLREGFSAREVSVRCGFSDPKYFSKVFKKHYGVLPSNYNMK